MTYFTAGQLDDDEISFGASDLTERVAVLLAGDPGGLLGIVRLGLILPFHLQRDEEVLGRIRIGSHILLWGRHDDDWLLVVVETKKSKKVQKDGCEGGGVSFSDERTCAAGGITRGDGVTSENSPGSFPMEIVWDFQTKQEKKGLLGPGSRLSTFCVSAVRAVEQQQQFVNVRIYPPLGNMCYKVI